MPLQCFNPRARGGRDAVCPLNLTSCTGFNPRARGGRDGCMYPRSPSETKFQSTRPRRARRVRLFDQTITTFVSIHAPAEGATADTIGARGVGGVSIHAPAEGATH